MVNRSLFLLDEIPTYHPQSNKYVEWWRMQKKYCIEGYWQSGFWMPSQLYFYVNFGTILINKTQNSKNKVPARPFLRDLEWEFFYNWVEARGFSGFALDDEFTCHRLADSNVYKHLSDFEKKRLKLYSSQIFKKDGSLKRYQDARTYLRKKHLFNMGRPLYQNDSKDFMMMGSRGFGKSYSVGVGIVLHEWLFDGQTEYIPPDKAKDEYNVTVCVGAGQAKYSNDLLNKTRFALEKMPGAQEIGGKSYPSPFSKMYTGSWSAGNAVTAEYKKKVGGRWEYKGTKSKITNRSFSDNPFAANGLRCSVMVFEEIGMFDNLIASRNASVECQQDGANKYGSMMFLGTGGDMDRGTIDAANMFNNPDSFNMITFEDKWENTGRIGYFVPAYLGLNQYKNENGITNVEAAKSYLENHRRKLRESTGGSSAIDDELQNRPLVPSEAFLNKRGNIFPTEELRQRLVRLSENDSYLALEKPVELYFSEGKDGFNGVNYKLDLDRKFLPLNNYPLSEAQTRNREGCSIIYEFPVMQEGKVPKGLYIIGHDPYKDDSTTGESLGAIYVLKTNKHLKHGHSEIVASFVGRPFEGRAEVNRQLLMLSRMYGDAKIFFENAVGNVKEFFEKVKRLDLLAHQPVTLFNKKASYSSNNNSIVYGYPMSSRSVKLEAIQYVRDWLIEERGVTEDGRRIRNLDLVPDKALLQELISFNYEGNFDRVMAFAGCVIGLEETYNRYNKHIEEKPNNDLDFLVNNKRLFKTIS